METALTVAYFCSISLGVIIVFGVIGNVLSLIVWSTGSQCSIMSCGYYFRLLAIADMFNLLVPGIVMLLEISPAYIILYDYNNFFCKILPFSAHYGVQLSSWITVSLTIERTLSIRYPMKFYHAKTKRHACSAFCLISIVAVFLDFVPLLFYEVENMPVDESFIFFRGKNSSLSANTTRPSCTTPELHQTFYRVWNIYISFGCFVVGFPPVIITCCNIITIVTLRRQWNSDKDSKHKRNNVTSVSFTYLVIIISIINCISTIPVGYLYIQLDYFSVNSSPVFYRVSLLLFLLNSGTNVIVYCIIGKTFREDLKTLLKPFCRRCISQTSECVVTLDL